MLRGFTGGQGEQKTPTIHAIIQANGGHACRIGARHHFRRCRQASRCQRCFGVQTSETEQNPLGVQIIECDLGAQHIFLQALDDGRHQIGSQGELIALVLPPDDKTGQHAPLRGAPGGMLRLFQAKVLDIAAQLVMQKSAGVLAAATHQAKMDERRQNRGSADGLQFLGSVTEIGHLGAFQVQVCACGDEEILPVWIHAVLSGGRATIIMPVPLLDPPIISRPMRLLRRLFFLCLLALAALVGLSWWWANTPLRLRNSPVEFRILPGSGLRAIVGQVAAAGVEVEPTPMVLLAKAMRVESSVKAGSYAISKEITPLELLKKLTSGDVTQAEITLLEGWTFRQWRERLDAHPELRHDTRGMAESDILARLKIEAPSLEGLFFPDTYLFDKHSSDLDVLARAYRTAKRRLELEWNQRAAGLPYKTPYEALIMASIIEKETGRDADRTLVAAVFINRLRLGMLLQTDPTVIYGMGERFDGNLRKRDLQTDTPYNTYTRAGLPPTTIAMPSMASLRAALHPADSDALYFVARGDGTSQFSRTLEEHNRAVNRYQRGRK